MNVSAIRPKPILMLGPLNDKPKMEKPSAAAAEAAVATPFPLPAPTAKPVAVVAKEQLVAVTGVSVMESVTPLVVAAKNLKISESEKDVKTQEVDERDFLIVKPSNLDLDEVDTADTDTALQALSKNAKAAARKKKRKKVIKEAAKAKAAAAATAVVEIVAEEDPYSFKLKPLGKDNWSKANGVTGLWESIPFFAERLHNCKETTAGDNHNWKRLNFSLIMFQYIEANAEGFSEFTFPEPTKGQFLATARFTPSGYKMHPRGSDNERVHIALLNKIVVMDTEENLFVVEDVIEVNQKKVTLHQFFNACDIISKTANAIDDCMEYYLRKKALDLCTLVKERKVTAIHAAHTLAVEYMKFLNVFDSFSQPSTSLALIKKDKKRADLFVAGMITGAKEFLVKTTALLKCAPVVEASFKASPLKLYELD